MAGSGDLGSRHVMKSRAKNTLLVAQLVIIFMGRRYKLRNHSFLPVSVGLKLDTHLLRGFPVFIGHCSGRFPFSDSIRILGGPAAACEVDQTANDQSKGTGSSDVFLHNQLRLGGKPHRLPRNGAAHNDNSLEMAILLHILVTSLLSRAFMPEL